ncbi:MAG: SMEK domain-containing protein [Clostridium sp.]
MSVLSSYIHHSNCCNMQDINILSESFMADLLNILYGWSCKMQMIFPAIRKVYLISPEDKILFKCSQTPGRL